MLDITYFPGLEKLEHQFYFLTCYHKSLGNLVARKKKPTIIHDGDQDMWLAMPYHPSLAQIGRALKQFNSSPNMRALFMDAFRFKFLRPQVRLSWAKGGKSLQARM